ncbi:MAG: phospho-N-acetylmuramoyl-pentapeptide-transferase [Opitutales bacterium]
MLIDLIDWLFSLFDADYTETPFRVLGFITFRTVVAAATALFLGFAIGPWIIERLRRLKAAQALRDASQVGKLADLHAGKKDTPTMGGLMIYITVCVSLLLWAQPNIYVLTCLFVYTGLTALGFADDYLKVSKRNSRGLPGRYKLLGQGLLTAGMLLLLAAWSDAPMRANLSEFWVPFVKDPLFVFGGSAAPWHLSGEASGGLLDFLRADPAAALFAALGLFAFVFVVMAGSSNAINLTDGVDGLAIGCTVTVALVYGVMAYATGHAIIADYLLISFVPQAGELAVICGAMVGASLAFLWYNSHPATVFMGDTGSLALGGLIGTIAFLVHQPITLILVGGIFVMEAVSVILQVFFFKTRGKRIFRMAPIHHHYELMGWAESKVVIRFWILSIIFAIAGLSTLKLR